MEYVCACLPDYKVTCINHVTRRTVHILHFLHFMLLATTVHNAMDVLQHNRYLTFYCHICVRKKYAYKITHMCHIFWGIYWEYNVHICTTYDDNVSNHVARSAVHIQQQYQW